tara:strand:- start:1229 stop:2977 length:1749 start_codon:yes stop_codon:yes gene_type:complete
MYIIGINAYHADSSACIIKDQNLIFAIEEERLRRIKHWAGFPILSIKNCLEVAKINLSDVDYICINSNPKVNIIKKIIHILKYRPSIKLIINKFRNKKKNQNIKSIIKREFTNDEFRGKIINIEHHDAHLASTFFVSPFKEACVVSIDGFGDFTSTAWGFGHNTEIEVKERIHFPHSLGIFYQSITQFLGFKKYGDEYKVMGLAPYGKPKYKDKLKKVLILEDQGKFKLNLNYFKFHKSNTDFKWDNGKVSFNDLYSNKLIDLLGKERDEGENIDQFHKDIAQSAQSLYEDAFINILNETYKIYKNKNICISGGCGMNSVANGKITKNTPFKNVYVQPAAGDAGGALGASYYTWHTVLKNKERFEMKHAYYGNSFDNKIIEKIIKNENNKLKDQNCNLKFYENFNELTEKVVNLISNGNVVGWFQDRMEWGPRALGNRSILADPRNPKMKNILNSKIKRRESFRPFAPSILKEQVSEWFEIDDDVPFMMKVFQIKEKKRSIIPAVTHIDGSGRLQTVYKDRNEKYYNLIKQFYKISKVPILLNTSFNENEPIINRPDEALNCFLRTKMDVLALGNYLIIRDK